MGGADPEKDGKRITDLLKYGAHAIMAPEAEEARAAGGEAFVKEDIDAILAGRTEKRQIGSRAGNTFSTATFSVHPADLVSLLSAAECILPFGRCTEVAVRASEHVSIWKACVSRLQCMTMVVRQI